MEFTESDHLQRPPLPLSKGFIGRRYLEKSIIAKQICVDKLNFTNLILINQLLGLRDN